MLFLALRFEIHIETLVEQERKNKSEKGVIKNYYAIISYYKNMVCICFWLFSLEIIWEALKKSTIRSILF